MRWRRRCSMISSDVIGDRTAPRCTKGLLPGGGWSVAPHCFCGRPRTSRSGPRQTTGTGWESRRVAMCVVVTRHGSRCRLPSCHYKVGAPQVVADRHLGSLSFVNSRGWRFAGHGEGRLAVTGRGKPKGEYEVDSGAQPRNPLRFAFRPPNPVTGSRPARAVGVAGPYRDVGRSGRASSCSSSRAPMP